MLKKNEILKIINSAAAQLSSAQLSSAQRHFKLFSSLCLLINYKILFCLYIKNLFKFFFEFIKFQFEKSIYLFKCFYKKIKLKEFLMRKQTKKILTLLTLFLVVLFAISCNKDISKRIKDKIPIFNKSKAENKGIGRYAGEWLASEIMMGEM